MLRFMAICCFWSFENFSLCLRASNAFTVVPCRLTHAAQMIRMDAMDAGHTEVNLYLWFQCFPTAEQALG